MVRARKNANAGCKAVYPLEKMKLLCLPVLLCTWYQATDGLLSHNEQQAPGMPLGRHRWDRTGKNRMLFLHWTCYCHLWCTGRAEEKVLKVLSALTKPMASCWRNLFK